VKYSTFISNQKIKTIRKLPFFGLTPLSHRFMRYIPMHPLFAGIHITNNCNSLCITCHRWKEKSEEECSLAEVKDALWQLKKLGIVYLSLSGGEPLLREDLPAIISYAHEYKFERIQLTTNGLLLTQKNIIEMVQSGLTHITISLNGGNQIHDITRGIKGTYNKTMEALRALVDLRDSKFPYLNVIVKTKNM